MGRKFDIQNSTLKHKDLEEIFDLAQYEYLSRNPSIFVKVEYFNILCIVEAYKVFLNRKKREEE